jgi:hypothetical protein
VNESRLDANAGDRGRKRSSLLVLAAPSIKKQGFTSRALGKEREAKAVSVRHCDPTSRCSDGVIHERGQRASNPTVMWKGTKPSASRVLPACRCRGERHRASSSACHTWYIVQARWWSPRLLQVCHTTRQNLAAVSPGRSKQGAVGKAPRKRHLIRVTRGPSEG